MVFYKTTSINLMGGFYLQIDLQSNILSCIIQLLTKTEVFTMVIAPKVQNVGDVWGELSGVARLEKYYIDRSVIEYDVERTINNLQETIKLSDNEFLFAVIVGYNRRNKDKGRFAIFRGKTFYDYNQHFE